MKNTREMYLKKLILLRFPSIRAFSEHIIMPYSTLTSILKNVGGASVTNLLKITKALGITLDDLASYGTEGIPSPTPSVNSVPSQILLRAKKDLPEEKFKELESMAEFFLSKYQKDS